MLLVEIHRKVITLKCFKDSANVLLSSTKHNKLILNLNISTSTKWYKVYDLCAYS